MINRRAADVFALALTETKKINKYLCLHFHVEKNVRLQVGMRYTRIMPFVMSYKRHGTYTNFITDPFLQLNGCLKCT